jgi:glycosyltransferase involved in cell wall biosynthesis
MERVLIVHLDTDPRSGGGSAVAAWTLEALRGRYQLGLLTWNPVDCEALNRYFGTSLRRSDVIVHGVPAAVRRLAHNRGLTLAKLNYLQRRCRRLGRDYDICIGTNNEIDFGRRGIQYVHFPRFHDPRINRGINRPLGDVDVRWFRSPALVRAYFRICGLSSGFSLERMRGNLTLTNSDWTARKVKEAHGIDAITVYPPVPGDFPHVPWEQRKAGFVCVGRIAPEKQLENVIGILSAVRAQGADVHLHIAGAPGPREYVERIRRLQAGHADWLFLEFDLPRAQAVRLERLPKPHVRVEQEPHVSSSRSTFHSSGDAAGATMSPTIRPRPRM